MYNKKMILGVGWFCLFSSLPLNFPPTVVGNITASVALILWANGQLPPPYWGTMGGGPEETGSGPLPHGASSRHSGRELFGLLNRFSASTASLTHSLSLTLTLWLSGNWLLPSNQIGVSQDWCGCYIFWGSRLGWKGVPAPSSALPRCASIPQNFQTSWDQTEHMVGAHLGRQRFGKLGRGE